MGASTILWVGAGGFLGAISRFVISSFVTKLAGASFPYGTLIVNIIGATAIGFLFLYFQNHASAPMRAFLITIFDYWTTWCLDNIFYLFAGDNFAHARSTLHQGTH